VKSPRQHVLDAMYPHRHVGRREAGNLPDGLGIQVFEIRNDDLAIERLQLLNQPRQSLQIQPACPDPRPYRVDFPVLPD
jgi:hypothetical protein